MFPDCAGVLGKTTPDGRVLETDTDFVHLLRPQPVAVIDGTPYGVPGTFRLSFAAALEDVQQAARLSARRADAWPERNPIGGRLRPPAALFRQPTRGSMMKRNVLAVLTIGRSAWHRPRRPALDDIKARGELYCGTLGTSQPFSYQDAATRTVVGYDVDMCAEAGGRQAGREGQLQAAVGGRARARTQRSRVDILAANLGYSPERAEQIAFSHTYYVSPQKLLVRKDSNLQTIESVNGRRVAATKGSSSEREIKRILDKSQVLGFTDSSGLIPGPAAEKGRRAIRLRTGAGAPDAAKPPTAPVSIIDRRCSTSRGAWVCASPKPASSPR